MLKKYKKILVTGADGFIGSHLVEALVSQGYSVKAFVCYNSFNSWGWLDHAPTDVQKKVEIYSGDIRDVERVNEAVKDCDAVLHLAALIAIPYSYHAPRSFVETNIQGTLNLLQAAKEFKVRRMIQTSTSEVYGSAQFVPITEEHVLQPQSPYSASKIAADQMSLSYFYSYNLPVVIARPFNTYGPRQSARAIIPTVISQLLSGAKELKLGALTPTRDLNYIQDTVSGFISLLESDQAVEGETFNIGSAFEISIGDLVTEIQSILKTNVPIVTDSARIRPENSEVQRLFSSNEKLSRFTDWKPVFGGREGLRKGLELTVKWFSQKENLSHYKSGLYNI